MGRVIKLVDADWTDIYTSKTYLWVVALVIKNKSSIFMMKTKTLNFIGQNYIERLFKQMQVILSYKLIYSNYTFSSSKWE